MTVTPYCVSCGQSGKATPVIFLTARDAVSDRVKGLDSGANDYLVKPFSFEELSARLRAHNAQLLWDDQQYPHCGGPDVGLRLHTVQRGGEPISLSAKEYALLEYLMRNREVVLSREKIENHIWNFDYKGGTNVVDVYIRYLRRKIDEGRSNKLIHTVRGSGYVLREEQ